VYSYIKTLSAISAHLDYDDNENVENEVVSNT